MSCGSLARFSAQSVSMMPSSGWSMVSKKPLSCQNWRTGCHSSLAGRPTLIQRSLPLRWYCTSATCSVAAGVPAARAARWPAW